MSMTFAYASWDWKKCSLVASTDAWSLTSILAMSSFGMLIRLALISGVTRVGAGISLPLRVISFWMKYSRRVLFTWHLALERLQRPSWQRSFGRLMRISFRSSPNLSQGSLLIESYTNLNITWLVIEGVSKAASWRKSLGSSSAIAIREVQLMWAVVHIQLYGEAKLLGSD